MGSRARSVVNKVLSIEQAEGVGARVRRSVGGAKVNQEFRGFYVGGFPFMFSPTPQLYVFC